MRTSSAEEPAAAAASAAPAAASPRRFGLPPAASRAASSAVSAASLGDSERDGGDQARVTVEQKALVGGHVLVGEARRLGAQLGGAGGRGLLAGREARRHLRQAGGQGDSEGGHRAAAGRGRARGDSVEQAGDERLARLLEEANGAAVLVDVDVERGRRRAEARASVCMSPQSGTSQPAPV